MYVGKLVATMSQHGMRKQCIKFGKKICSPCVSSFDLLGVSNQITGRMNAWSIILRKNCHIIIKILSCRRNKTERVDLWYFYSLIISLICLSCFATLHYVLIKCHWSLLLLNLLMKEIKQLIIVKDMKIMQMQRE